MSYCLIPSKQLSIYVPRTAYAPKPTRGRSLNDFNLGHLEEEARAWIRSLETPPDHLIIAHDTSETCGALFAIASYDRLEGFHSLKETLEIFSGFKPRTPIAIIDL